MEIELLHSFIEIYDSGSISQAAKDLFISPSAMSRRLQILENELKIELFQRKGALMEPTDAAKTLYKEANKILRQHDQAIIKMNQFKKGQGGYLRVGVMQTLKQAPTVQAISLMRQKYPDVELSFDCDKNSNIPYFMANRKIDVGITVFGEIRGQEGFAYELLSRNTLAVMIGRNHRLWNKRPLYAEDLNGEKLYYIDGATAQSVTAVAQYYKEQQVNFSELIPCRSITEQLLYLAKGDGVAHAGIVSSEEYFSMLNLIDVVPVERSSLDQGYVVALYDQDNELAKKFVEFLKSTW